MGSYSSFPATLEIAVGLGEVRQNGVFICCAPSPEKASGLAEHFNRLEANDKENELKEALAKAARESDMLLIELGIDRELFDAPSTDGEDTAPGWTP